MVRKLTIPNNLEVGVESRVVAVKDLDRDKDRKYRSEENATETSTTPPEIERNKVRQ